MIIPETPIEWLRAWAESGILPHTEYIKEVERRKRQKADQSEQQSDPPKSASQIPQ